MAEASPTPHRLQPLPVGRGMSTRGRPSSTSCFHLLLPPRLFSLLGNGQHTPSPLPCPPALSLSLPRSFSPHGRSRHGHSAEKHRGQLPPRSHYAIPELRPDPVELHTRRTRPEEAAVDRSVVVFISGARRSPSSIRRCRGFPEPTELLSRPLVSPCPFPLSPRARPCLLTTPAVGADSSSPPTMSQTVLESP